eukprot:Seg5741.1 transcript_id=Seg5741.1/GoldUCD/mRNA.D3Y31 product="hypothetical protein" protein_id=Seg5741.1/GoldUCD/D3Y31
MANTTISKSTFRHNHYITGNKKNSIVFRSAISYRILPTYSKNVKMGTLSAMKNAVLYVERCKFFNNTGLFGGAVQVYARDELQFSTKNCTFESNVGILSGGAINIVGNVQLDISNTVFSNNFCFAAWFSDSIRGISVQKSGVGGAISLQELSSTKSQYNPMAVFDRCIFKGNGAETSGGSIYSSSHALILKNVSMQSNTNHSMSSLQGVLITSKGRCRVRNSSFEVMNAVDIRTAVSFDSNQHYGIAILIDNISQFLCPVGSQILEKNVKYSKIEVKGFTNFALYCIPCPINHYNLNKSILTSYARENARCERCPPGGKCQSGIIKARDNFWGQLNNKTNLIKFFMLPSGYGCKKSQCQSYYSCAANRKGILCGECEKSYSESMLSSRCIANRDCQVKKFWITAFVLVIAYILFFLYKKDLIMILKTKVLSFHVPSLSCKNEEDCIHEDMISNDQFQDGYMECNDVPENEMRNEEIINDEQDQNFFAGFLKIIFYFYQIEKLLISYEDEIKNNFIQGLKTTVSSFFNFHFLTGSGSGSMACPSLHATPVTNVLTRALLLLIMFGLLGLSYLVNKGFYLIKKAWKKDGNVQEHKGFCDRVLMSAFEVVLLSYALIAKIVFSLLTCVSIGDVHVLYMQGNIRCYHTYQYALIAIGMTWVLPFCLLIFCLPTSIDREFIGRWSIFGACLFPMPFVVYLVMKLITGKQSNGEEPVVKDSVCKAILKNLTGSFKCISKQSMHWEGFYLLRRLILVSAYSFIKDPIYKSYTIQVIQILILVHHVNVKPFKSKVLNVLETISLSILVLISGMNSFAIFVYTHGIHEEGDYLMLLKVFAWIRLVAILFIPAVIGCIVAVLVTVKLLIVLCIICVFVVRKLIKKCC